MALASGSESLHGTMELTWPSWPMHYRLLRLESMTPGALCACQLLRDPSTLSGKETVKTL